MTLVTFALICVSLIIGFVCGVVTGHDIRIKEDDWSKEKPYMTEEEVGRLPQ